MSHPLAKFDQTGDFEAVRAAEAALSLAGFSIGACQKGAPRGILFGDVTISKWRNMTRSQQLDLHAQMWGGRQGPVTVMLHADAPGEAVKAFRSVWEAADAAQARAAA